LILSSNFCYLENLAEIEKDSRIYIYGKGSFGQSFLRSLEIFRPDILVEGFIDSFNAGDLLGLPIIKADQFNISESDYDYVVICSEFFFWSEIVSKVKEIGVKNYFVNLYWDFDVFGDKSLEKYNQYQCSVPEVRAILSDTDSQLLWDVIADAMCKQNVRPILEYWDNANRKNNYHKYINLKNGDIVINGGAAFGDETNKFSTMVGVSGKVFAFDPNIITNEDDSKNVINVPKVLWNKTARVLFQYDTSRSMIVDSDNETESCVEAVTLKDFLESATLGSLDLLKLDVEGVELDILINAEKTIKKYRPILAISVYHKLEHFFEIPLFLNDMLSNYHFYLDCFSPFSIDTVIFAVPFERY